MKELLLAKAIENAQKHMGEPINTRLPVPVELKEICNLDTAEVGEKVYTFSSLDTDNDTIIASASDGSIQTVKRTAIGDAEVSFTDLESQEEYILVKDVLAAADKSLFARKKARLSHGLDKRELKLVLDLIMSPTSGDIASGITEETLDSGEDLYDVIQDMLHDVEDYGDSLVLLEGTNVKKAIDKYIKVKAASFNYKITIKDLLRENNVTRMKIFGQVESTVSGGMEALLDADKCILVARNSRIAPQEQKPIWFIRRKISAEIAELMGADVSTAQRATIIVPTPVQVSGNKRAFAVYATESIVAAVTNSKSIVKSGDLIS